MEPSWQVSADHMDSGGTPPPLVVMQKGPTLAVLQLVQELCGQT